jgi:hypothetical protein
MKIYSKSKVKEVMATSKPQLTYPENHYKTIYIKPENIPLDLITRLKCEGCGLF